MPAPACKGRVPVPRSGSRSTTAAVLLALTVLPLAWAAQDRAPAPADVPGAAPPVAPGLSSTPAPPAAPPVPVPLPGAPQVTTAPPPADDPAAAAPAPAQLPDRPPAQPDVTVRGRHRRGDPLAPINARAFDAAQGVDRALIGPVARAYGRKSPGPVRDGIRNFLSNLREPVVFANYVLQLKPGKAAETAGRFVLNSTLGVAGLFDPARRRPFNLPRRRNSFANTLGYWGVGPGPFFFLPLVGATTLRDLVGNAGDQLLPFPRLPVLREPAVGVPLGLLSALDYRAQYDGALACLRSAPDPYAAARAFYLARRRAEIDALRGRPSAAAAAVPPGPYQAPTARGVAAALGGAECPASPAPPRPEKGQ